MFVSLWPFVSKKVWSDQRNNHIFCEMVELKEGGSGLDDGDLLLRGLHPSCDMDSGLKAWMKIHFLASTLTLSPITRSHFCCTPTKGQCSKAPSIKPFVHFIDRPRCDSNSTSLWSCFSSPPSLNLSLLPAPRSCHQSPPSCNLPRLSPSLPTFSFKS